MLKECGGNVCSHPAAADVTAAMLALLRSYLDSHVARMSRTTLRYAIERLPEPERREWMRR